MGYVRIVIDLLERSQRSNPQRTLCLPYVIQVRQGGETDYSGGGLDLVLHVDEQVCSASQKLSGRLVAQDGTSFLNTLRLLVVEFW